VEAWVRADWTELGYNPCIFSDRDGVLANWSIHLNSDKRAIGMWNGLAYQTIALPDAGMNWHHLAVEFQHPIVEKRRPLPAVALGSSTALVTAIGNDGDFARAFVDELELLAGPEDAVLALSSSGASANVNRALRRARERRLLTVGFAGRDGGAMADLCEFLFVVPSWSIHRIQETHTALVHLLWDEVHVALGEPDVL